MRGINRWPIATVIALSTVIPISQSGAAGAQGRDPVPTPDTMTVAASDVRVERIRLECAVRPGDDRVAVHCEWSMPTSARAAGVQLVRLDPAVDDHRRVVFRTTDLAQTTFTDPAVRRGHRYAYAIVVVDANGRSVGRSDTDWVRIPSIDDRVELIRLACKLGPAAEAIGCTWSRPDADDVAVISLWRSVDGGARELVHRFRPSGPTAYRDPVPPAGSRVTYAVVATDASGAVVARSRPSTVRLDPPEVGRS